MKIKGGTDAASHFLFSRTSSVSVKKKKISKKIN